MGLIITLIILGILLIIAEIILIPGIFVTGMIGLISLGASCYFAFSEFGQEAGIITVAVNILLVCSFVVLALRAKTWKRLSLNAEIDSRIDTNPEKKGIKTGQEGFTITRLAPVGKIIIDDKTVEATSQHGIIDPQRKIEVTLIDDNKIYVREI